MLQINPILIDSEDQKIDSVDNSPGVERAAVTDFLSGCPDLGIEQESLKEISLAQITYVIKRHGIEITGDRLLRCNRLANVLDFDEEDLSGVEAAVNKVGSESSFQADGFVDRFCKQCALNLNDSQMEVVHAFAEKIQNQIAASPYSINLAVNLLKSSGITSVPQLSVLTDVLGAVGFKLGRLDFNNSFDMEKFIILVSVAAEDLNYEANDGACYHLAGSLF